MLFKKEICMIKINLNKIYSCDDLKEIDLEKIKQDAQTRKVNSLPANYPDYSLSVASFNRASELLYSRELYQSEIERQMFLSSYVFDDNMFLQVLERYQMDLHQLYKILTSFLTRKKKYQTINIISKNLELLKKHYNLTQVEIILNKVSELTYFQEYSKSKQKTKKSE